MDWDKFWMSLLAVLVVAGLLFGGTALVLFARANGETDYCYIEWYNASEAPPLVRLMAHVPWRENRRIAYYQTAEEATAQAAKMKCPLGHR